MSLKSWLTGAALGVTLVSGSAQAHFLELLPSKTLVTPESGRSVNLSVVFTHPFDGGPTMQLEEPLEIGVIAGGVKTDLKGQLKPKIIDGKQAFDVKHKVKAPADYIYYVKPQPYFDVTEQIFISQYTKVVVDAYGAEEGWHTMVGFPVEIKPLVRPYGLWSGMQFAGVVMKGGEAQPYVDIEVEYRTADNPVDLGKDGLGTIVITTDHDGIFHFTMPKPGWWGFAALFEADKPIVKEGKSYSHEEGAVMWVKAADVPSIKR